MYLYIYIYILQIIPSISMVLACRQLHIPARADFLEHMHVLFL